MNCLSSFPTMVLRRYAGSLLSRQEISVIEKKMGAVKDLKQHKQDQNTNNQNIAHKYHIFARKGIQFLVYLHDIDVLKCLPPPPQPIKIFFPHSLNKYLINIYPVFKVSS